MGAILSYFNPPPAIIKKTPISGAKERIINIFKNHYKGLVGVIVPLVTLSWQGSKTFPFMTVKCMWLWMLWFFLLQPVSIPVTALIPIFLLPMAGIMSSVQTCACYMNEGIMLFILGTMLGLLMNNSGVDRRIALWFLSCGAPEQFSGPKFLFKCTAAAFLLSMVCNRLIVASVIIEYVAPAFMALSGPLIAAKPNYVEMRYVMCQAIQTSAAIGSIAIVHSSYATLTFRTIFYWDKSMPDLFNYSQYSTFAIPVALVMYGFNLGYHIILLNIVGGKISADSMMSLRDTMLRHKRNIPAKVTGHEILSLIFTALSLFCFFTRWSSTFKGWAFFNMKPLTFTPLVKDATVAAIFVVLLHALPKSLGCFKIFTAKKKSEMKLKPESAILWWRFVDKNINYGYIFLIGSGVALNAAIRHTKLDVYISNRFAYWVFTKYSWSVSLVIVCFVSVFLANIMSGCAACVVLLPCILNMNKGIFGLSVFRSWRTDAFIGALAVGLGSSLGFMFPFLYTPAYFSHYSGKVPMKKMAMYGGGSAVVCLIVLCGAVTMYAPRLWVIGVGIGGIGGIGGAGSGIGIPGAGTVTMPSMLTMTTTTTTTTTTDTPEPDL